MIKVLIIDDSATDRMAIRNALSVEPDIVVVGEAADGRSAIDMITRVKPDILTMDVHLKNENGIELTAAIMSSTPIPILIVTQSNPNDPKLIFKAIEAGALEIRGKLPYIRDERYEPERRLLIRQIRALSEVPVVTHKFRQTTAKNNLSDENETLPQKTAASSKRRGRGVILIGASTGGPAVIASILKKFNGRLSVPIVIVQHISAGFSEGLATWLGDATGLSVELRTQNGEMRDGVVYLPPDSKHLAFNAAGWLGPSDAPPKDYQKPSINVLFESAAEAVKFGSISVAAVILSGMGVDGAEGLKKLREAGCATFAQDPASCVADSMPRSAIERGAAERAAHPDVLAEILLFEAVRLGEAGKDITQ